MDYTTKLEITINKWINNNIDMLDDIYDTDYSVSYEPDYILRHEAHEMEAYRCLTRYCQCGAHVLKRDNCPYCGHKTIYAICEKFPRREYTVGNKPKPFNGTWVLQEGYDCPF